MQMTTSAIFRYFLYLGIAGLLGSFCVNGICNS